MGKYFCGPVSHLQTSGDSFKELSVSCEVFILFKLVARLKDKTAGNRIGGEHCAFTICKKTCNSVVYLLLRNNNKNNFIYAEKAIKHLVNRTEVSKYQQNKTK